MIRMIPIINAIRSSVSSIDRCVIPIFFDVFLFLASQCVNVSRTKVGKIEISGNKKDMALEKLSCAAICYISFAESFSANSLISLFKNTESTVLTMTTPPRIANSSNVGSTTVFSMSEAIRNSNPSKR